MIFGMVRSILSMGPWRVRQAEPGPTDADVQAGQDTGASDAIFAAVAYKELLLAIETMTVTWRPSRQGDDISGPIVVVATLGGWTWQDRDHTKARVQAKYPELSAQECVRAAKLIEAQIGKRNLRAFRQVRSVDRFDREEQQFWEGHNV